MVATQKQHFCLIALLSLAKLGMPSEIEISEATPSCAVPHINVNVCTWRAKNQCPQFFPPLRCGEAAKCDHRGCVKLTRSWPSWCARTVVPWGHKKAADEIVSFLRAKCVCVYVCVSKKSAVPSSAGLWEVSRQYLFKSLLVCFPCRRGCVVVRWASEP